MRLGAPTPSPTRLGVVSLTFDCQRRLGAPSKIHGACYAAPLSCLALVNRQLGIAPGSPSHYPWPC